MDFKVKCIGVPTHINYLTVGKIYDVIDGKLVADDGFAFTTWAWGTEPNFRTFDDFFRNHTVEFELVQELKYKIGDRVVITNSNIGSADNERTGVIVDIDEDYDYPYLVHIDNTADDIWCTVSDLVEEKKVFTKSDLKNGMFGVMDCGKKFVIVNNTIVYQEGGFDRVSTLNNDLELIHRKIDKLWDGVKSFYQLEKNIKYEDTEYGELVYDRERDTIRELTIEEIEKEFGIKVKFERV